MYAFYILSCCTIHFSYLGGNFLKIDDYKALLIGGQGETQFLANEAQSFTIENGFKVEYDYSEMAIPGHYLSVAFLTEERFFKCEYDIRKEPEGLIFAKDAGLLTNH